MNGKPDTSTDSIFARPADAFEALKEITIPIEERLRTIKEMEARIWTAVAERAGFSYDPFCEPCFDNMATGVLSGNGYTRAAFAAQNCGQTALDKLRCEDPELGAIVLELTRRGVREIRTIVAMEVTHYEFMPGAAPRAREISRSWVEATTPRLPCVWPIPVVLKLTDADASTLDL